MVCRCLYEQLHGCNSLLLTSLLTSTFEVLFYSSRALITTKQKNKVVYFLSASWTPAMFQVLEGLVWRSEI